MWAKAGVDPGKSSGDWYLETGSGMGATFNTPVGKHAYGSLARDAFKPIQDAAGKATKKVA